MFLRKLTVIVVPLLLALALCLLLPLAGGLGFFAYVIRGAALGAALALLLPLSGAGRKKEPFAGLLWVPAGLLAAVVAYQYFSAAGVLNVPILSLLHASGGQTVQTECAFAGYMAVTCVRTRK